MNTNSTDASYFIFSRDIAHENVSHWPAAEDCRKYMHSIPRYLLEVFYEQMDGQFRQKGSLRLLATVPATAN